MRTKGEKSKRKGKGAKRESGGRRTYEEKKRKLE